MRSLASYQLAGLVMCGTLLGCGSDALTGGLADSVQVTVRAN